MIRMTGIHLINWHNFQDDVIDFKNITYLLGVNAVGKTTIMDAIRYCLTTNKDFNTAGNKKSGRTLLGSVHQKQRAEDSYLRPGHTVSYIGIEFLDESIKKNFVITVRVESETPKQDLKGVYQDWYITKPGIHLKTCRFLHRCKEARGLHQEMHLSLKIKEWIGHQIRQMPEEEFVAYLVLVRQIHRLVKNLMKCFIWGRALRI